MDGEYHIFTFGYNQQHEGRYVKVYGDYREAREKMMEKYGSEWGFQYTSEQWQDWINRKPDCIPLETFLEEF